MSSQSSLVLLNRILSLKDGLPFILVTDSLAQSGHYMIQEIAHKSNNEIMYLSFETVNKPKFATHFLDCMDFSPIEIVKKVKELVSNSSSTSPSASAAAATASATKKTLIVIDAVNSIPIEHMANFISSLISPTTIVLGVYHDDSINPLHKYPNFPSHRKLLNYIASSVFEVEPYHKVEIDEEELDNDLNKLKVPAIASLNSPVFKITLINRRKSGRSITSQFVLNTTDHSYEPYKETSQSSEDPEDESMLKDLTTFNLTTNLKQKLAKEQVELPFMQAQEELGSYSGAIVYEFEKDDDYDEEDPYEDPF